MSAFLRQLVIYLLMVSFGTASKAASAIDKIVMSVNGVAITQHEVEKRLSLIKRHRQRLGSIERSEAINSLITEVLMLQIAQKDGLNLDSEAVKQIAMQMIREGEVPLEMSSDINQLKREIILNVTQQKLLRSLNLMITEEEVLAQMQDLPKVAPQTEEVRFHIETLLIPIQAPRATSSMTIWQQLTHFFKWRGFSQRLSGQPFSSQSIEIARQAAKEALSSAKQGTSFLKLATEQKDKRGWKVEDIQNTADKLPSIYLNVLTHLLPGEVAGPLQFHNGFRLVRLKGASGPSVAHVRHILLTVSEGVDPEKTKQRLVEIRQRCLEGEDFAKQAEKYSEDPYTVFKGGDLNWVFQGSLDPVFDEQINSLKPGQVSLPFKTALGWHIMQLMQKQWLTANHLERKKYIARKYVEEQKMVKVLKDIQEELYAAAHIEWIDDDLKRETLS